jgi:hypothetical protein
MSRTFSPYFRRVLAVAAVVGLATVPATTATAAKVRPVEVASVTIDQVKVVGGDNFTGTVTLNQTAPTDVQVIVEDSDAHPDYATVQGNPITVPVGSSSASFTGTTTTPAETDTIVVDARLADGSSTVTPAAEFVLVPTAQTDLIEVTRATMSRKGVLTVTAVSENPAATLTAIYNGQDVPGETVDGKFRGQLDFGTPTSGEVVVRSDLGGCAKRNPFGSSGSEDCIP